jgi:hypothetical protein
MISSATPAKVITSTLPLSTSTSTSTSISSTASSTATSAPLIRPIDYREYVITEMSGTHKEYKCPLCLTDMIMEHQPSVQLAHWIQTCSTTAFDHWICPNGPNNWHKQARRILYEAKTTASNILHNLLVKEAESIIATRIATRIVPIA